MNSTTLGLVPYTLSTIVITKYDLVKEMTFLVISVVVRHVKFPRIDYMAYE